MAMCCLKHVEQLRNTVIINSITWLHLVGSFYEFYIMMHRSMNIKKITSVSFELSCQQEGLGKCPRPLALCIHNVAVRKA
jgi:hypothetical protein